MRRIAGRIDPEIPSDGGRIRVLTKFLKFVILGIPPFLVAIPLNFALVEWAGMNKQVAYALVLFIQININFLLLKVFLFRNEGKPVTVREYFSYLAGVSFFRFLDWGVYALLIPFAGKYYLVVQILNTFVFMVLKFIFIRHILENKNNDTLHSDTLLQRGEHPAGHGEGSAGLHSGNQQD